MVFRTEITKNVSNVNMFIQWHFYKMCLKYSDRPEQTV